MLQDIALERMSNGNSLTADAYPRERFDCILANPPYGVDWKGYGAPGFRVSPTARSCFCST